MPKKQVFQTAKDTASSPNRISKKDLAIETAGMIAACKDADILPQIFCALNSYDPGTLDAFVKEAELW